MINFFKQRSVFLAAAFFVLCESHGSLIPYDFCGKMIKRNPAYEKIPVSNQPAALLCSDMWKEVGIQYLNVNNKSFFSVHGILNKWTQSFSLNQYVNFISLVSNLAKKTKFDVNIVLSFIDEKYEHDFFEGIEAVKMYKSLSEKIKINNPLNPLTADEYKFIKILLIGKYALASNKNTVYVKRNLQERFYITKKELTENMLTANIINITALFILPAFGLTNFAERGYIRSLTLLQPIDLFLFLIQNGITNNSSIIKVI